MIGASVYASVVGLIFATALIALRPLVMFRALVGLPAALYDYIAEELFRAAPMGVGAGLPTSESIVVPLDGADYLDLTVPGDGSSVRGGYPTAR